MNRDELARGLREAAYLEGDFVLRSGRRSKYYLDKYRFETRPDLLRALGSSLANAVREHESAADRLAGPELGAVALAAAASLETGLPFLIVRKEAKDYGTANRLEGLSEPRRVRLPDRGRRHLGRSGGRGRRWRSARPVCVCPTRSAWSIAKKGVSTSSRAMRCASGRCSGPPSCSKPPQIRMVERYPTALLGFPQGLIPSTRRRRMFVDQAGLHPEGRREERAVGS